MRPSLVARPAFFAALARPFLRRIVVASSKFPFASSSAVLQFSMPAPVWSRSFFTSDALIVAIGVTRKKKKGKSGVSTAEGSSLKKTFDPLLALRGSRGRCARAAGRPGLPPGGVIAGGIVGPFTYRFDVG